jgi:peptidyl-prolyl cis-trans isomerase A (cyclophilin A)
MVVSPYGDLSAVARGAKAEAAEADAMASQMEAIEIKRKMYFEHEGAPYRCLEAEVSKPTARGGQTLVRPKMRNLLTRAVASSLRRKPQQMTQWSVAVAIVLSPFAAFPQSNALTDPSQLTETAPEVYRARFETSKGPFVIEVHREWAPIAADRFYNLVKNGFYDGTRFFRVRPGFMAQFGINGNPEIQSAWQRAFLRDDPVTKTNVRGFVSFTNEGRSQSRFTQIFINYSDNSRLDADGFAPFGEVVAGMEVVDKLFSPSDPQPDQRRILREGNDYLQKEFPKLDFVKKATIVPVTPAGPGRR